MNLSILIRTIKSREKSLLLLLNNLYAQIVAASLHLEVEVLWIQDNKEITSGEKANQLLQMAKGKYVVFIDDDDDVPGYYISETLKAIESDPDCVATNGTYSIDGSSRIKWYLSKDNQDCDGRENGALIFLRRTNHISPVKRELALMAGFPDKSNAEDKAYSDKLIPLLKTETKIELPMYHYKYSSRNKEYV